MNYNQITEGIINVPQELLSKVNVYVSSLVAFKLKQFSERFELLNSTNYTPEEKQRILNDIKQTIGKLQQKYGAKNISSQTAQQIEGKNVSIKLDFDKFFKELNYKGITPEMVEQVKNKAKFELYIVGGASDVGGSVSNDGSIVRLMVHIGRLNGRESLKTADAIMRTVYHECQHVVQDFAIKTIDKEKDSAKPNKQVQRPTDYDTEAGYYTSGVEYTPQLGDVINLVSDILERDAIAGKLDQKVNRAINNALVDAYHEDNTVRSFLGHIRQKNPEGYKRALKTIYSKVAPIHQTLVRNGVDYRYSDLEPEELETNINVLATVLQMARKNSDAYEIDGRQRGDDIQWLTIKSKKQDWKITVAPYGSGKYSVSLDYKDFSDNAKLDSQKLLNFMGIITSSSYYEADDVLADLDHISDSGSEMTDEKARSIIESLIGDAKHFGIATTDEGGSKFSIAGLPLTIEPYEDDKTKLVLKDDSENLFFVLPSAKVLMLMQSFITACLNNEEEAKEKLVDFSSYIEKINNLRNM
ncbi:hypothetical protein AAGG91_002588 [Salmonella enterica]